MSGSPLAGVEVRAATERDAPRMAELDRLAFGAAGMGHYDETYVRCWLEVNPEGLLLASRDGTAVACCYSQYVDFSPDDVSLLTTDAAFTDSGMLRNAQRCLVALACGLECSTSLQGCRRRECPTPYSTST
jgi:hypothetical protein